MKYRFPAALKKSPFKIFDKAEKPVFILILISGIIVRGWSIGKSSSGFELSNALIGALLTAVMAAAVFFLSGGRRLSQLARFWILYAAFSYDVKITYLSRIIKPSVMFEVRSDLLLGKTSNALALWFPDFTGILLIAVPFIVIMLMAINANKAEIEKNAPGAWTVVMYGAVCLCLAALALPFLNMSNLCRYLIYLLLISLMWRLWECLRNRKSLEPASIVAWAEIALFAALWLKGIVECL